MNQALWVAKTGLDAQQTRLAVISNNLANVGTTGFKQSRAVFEDLLYQNLRQVGAQSSEDTRLPSGLMLGTGTRVVATEKIHTQGNIENTGKSLDVAIDGKGFFPILLPDGSPAYTRDGSFMVSDQGQLVTASGYALQPGITLPADAQSVTIGIDGVVSAQLQGQAAPTGIAAYNWRISSTRPGCSPSARISTSNRPPAAPPRKVTRARPGSAVCVRVRSKVPTSTSSKRW